MYPTPRYSRVEMSHYQRWNSSRWDNVRWQLQESREFEVVTCEEQENPSRQTLVQDTVVQRTCRAGSPHSLVKHS